MKQDQLPLLPKMPTVDRYPEAVSSFSFNGRIQGVQHALRTLMAFKKRRSQTWHPERITWYPKSIVPLERAIQSRLFWRRGALDGQ
jgi:hypothetical protein